MSPSPEKEPTSISSLPDDLLLNCLARVSRSYHQTLYFVCKKFRSIIKSQELYNIRSLLNRTEKCLYVCLRNRLNPEPQWFTLAKKSTGYGLEHFRPLQGLLPCQSTGYHLIAVGYNIYKFGRGYTYDLDEGQFSSVVSVLDCRSHTWHAAPNMRVGRSFYSTASVVDGKIYVAGGCKDPNSRIWVGGREEPIGSLNWIEVFDPETQSWSSVTSPNIKGSEVKSLELEGKFYLFSDRKCVVYDPKEGKWNPSGIDLSTRYSYGVIDKVLFLWDDRLFQWYDTKVNSWKKLNGLERDRHYYSLCHDSKMVDLGGKMAVLWDQYTYYAYGEKVEKDIWCCVISLERRYGDDGDEMWGKVEWSESLITIDSYSSCFSTDRDHCVFLSATL